MINNKEHSKYFRAALAPTLVCAASHPFYSAHWGGEAIRDIFNCQNSFEKMCSIFNALPIISRQDLQYGVYPIIDEDDQIVLIGHTTGTTGNPLMWYLTLKEIELQKKIRSKLSNKSSHLELKKLQILIYPPVHSIPNCRFRAGDDVYIFEGSIENEKAFNVFKWLLTSSHSIPGFEKHVSIISGPSNILVTATQGLIELGISSDQTHIKRIETFGGYLNKFHKDFLLDFWGISPIDIYSMSEIPGGGPICPLCGYIYFQPDVHYSVIALDTSLPSQAGIGRLVLTALWPKKVAQPIVRYINGDIVGILDHNTACCNAHVGGVRILGRISKSVVYQEDNSLRSVILSSNEIRDTFFSPMVGKDSSQINLPFLKNRSLIGAPKVTVPTLVRPGETLTIYYEPSSTFSSDDSDLRASLLKISHNLRNALDQGKIGLSVIQTFNGTDLLYK